MNGAIHAAAAEQRRVGGIHNRLHPLPGDVTGDDGDAVGNELVGHAGWSPAFYFTQGNPRVPTRTFNCLVLT